MLHRLALRGHGQCLRLQPQVLVKCSILPLVNPEWVNEQERFVCTAHRRFKRPPKPDDQTAASQDGPRRDVCGSEIVAAAPIRTVSPLPLGLVGP